MARMQSSTFFGYESFNDVIRFLIDRAIGLAALYFRMILFLRMKTYYFSQAWLRYRYGITAKTQVHAFDQYTRDSVELRFGQLGSTAVYALTSGSTNEPKKIAYNRRRLKATRSVFIDVFFRYLANLPKNRSLFIFSSFEQDQSLTTMLLQESGLPPFISGLQAPHRVQNHTALQSAVRRYGDTAVRLWILAISNPGLIYATNPSTIATFLHEIRGKWESSIALIADYVNLLETGRFFSPDGNRKKDLLELFDIHKRIASRGSWERMKKIANSLEPLTVNELIPGLRAFSCWNGGYVSPFIEQIRQHLPADQYIHMPMYSMSTETIQTFMGTKQNHLFFIPMAPGVYYEFIEEGKEDQTENLLGPGDLISGTLYSMVVSDDYGLKRYQTEDLFECAGIVSGIPDLHFIRRRNLSYSFTGEKLTAEQFKLAFSDAESFFPELRQFGFLTCFPSKSVEELLPGYRLIFIQTNGAPLQNLPEIASLIEQKLCEYNSEFKSKVESRRLSHLTFESIPIRSFVHAITGANEGSSWGSQVKILPLYMKLWEAL